MMMMKMMMIGDNLGKFKKLANFKYVDLNAKKVWECIILEQDEHVKHLAPLPLGINQNFQDKIL